MNKTRCPWCGKLIDKEADSEEYRKKYFYYYSVMKLSFGRHYGVCSHCGQIYNNVPRSALISLCVLLGVAVLLPVIPMIAGILFIALLPIMALISSRDSHFKRIDDNNSGVIKYHERQKFKARVIEQYRDMYALDIFPIFKEHDEKEPFSHVSPIFVTKIDAKSTEIEGYWLYEHADNAYFATLGTVHIYDDEGEVVADITFI